MGTQWTRPYSSYRTHELRVLVFPSQKDCDRCLEVLIREGCPTDTNDGRTLFVPEEAITMLQAKKLRFEVEELVDIRKLTPDELAKVRREHGM